MKRTAVIEWTEQARYSVTVTLPDDAPEAVGNGDNVRDWLEEQGSGDGESRWFGLVENQKSDWPTQDLMEVSERDVSDITLIDEDEPATEHTR